MAGQANRIFNFCNEFKGTPGCVIQYAPPPKPAPKPNCNDPYSIGKNSCTQYKIYIDRLESITKSSDRQILTKPDTQIIVGYNQSTTFKIYSDKAATKAIGEAQVIINCNYDVPFDSSTGDTVFTYTGLAQCSSRVSLRWIKSTAPSVILASIDTQIDYCQSIDRSSGYLGPLLVTKSYQTGGQLLSKNCGLTLSASENIFTEPIQTVTIRLSNA
jgi:hypothetical protein